jgi:teichuronic acid biosynthesis glycosyltransferase TuaC
MQDNPSKLHVLVVSNHWGAQKSVPSSGVFVDRQISSLENAGVKISRFDIGMSHSLFTIVKKWLELRRLVRTIKPDIVHGRYGTTIGLMAAFTGRPAVVSYCGGDLRGGHCVSLMRQYCGFFLSNLAALRARMLICVSEDLRQALWWRKARAVVIPDGVDIRLFSPGSRDFAREQLGWELTKPIVILNVRNDPNLKGLDVAKKAMEIVCSRLPESELCLIKNVEPNQMPLYYRAADALLCASLSEGSPNVVKEALACDLPVVSTPVGDVPERLAGVHPTAVVPRDPQAIAEALIKILLERKRCNGREHVRNLSLEATAQRVISVYRVALCQGSVIG